MSRTKFIALGVVLAAVVVCATCVGTLAFFLGPEHEANVPADAKPQGFDRLMSWRSCGATGDYCAQTIVFGSRVRSYRDAAAAIVDRYRKKGWNVPTDVADDRDLFLPDPKGDACISLRLFDIASYTATYHFHDDAPDPQAVAARIEPYPVVMEVVGSPCP